MNSSANQKTENSAAVRRLGGQTTIVMGGTAFTFIVGFPFQIYLARELGAAGLGLVGIAEALVMTVSGLLGLGLAPLAVRYIPEYLVSGASRAIRQLIILGLTLLTGLGAIGALLLVPLASVLPQAVGITQEMMDLLVILSILLPISMISFFIAQALRGFQEIWMVVLSTSFLALLIKVILTFFLFNANGASPQNYAWAMVGSQGVAILPMTLKLWRLASTLPQEATPLPLSWRAMTSFAGTNYASGALNALVGNLDRIVIGALLGPSGVGVLMVARQLQQFPTVFHQVVLTVVSPVFARLKAAGDVLGLAHQLHLANDWILRMAAGLIIVLAVLADHILGLYGPDFAAQGTPLLLLMIATVLLNLGTGPVGILLNMTGLHVVLFRVVVITSVTTFAAYFLFIPVLGVSGAGLAVLVGTAINKGGAIWLVKKRLGISWYDRRFRGWVIPSIAAAAVLFALRPVFDGIQGLGARATLLMVVTTLAYFVFFGVNLLVGLHEDDLEVIAAMRARVAALRNRGSHL
ncbi:oligosaccharide flippase family protein (plasmid) [Sulfitobacter sp. W027]|uniref:oligosaccharide flippase family protein n=1 Tax=Sulfitobacter sp. W027 TaxID=2867025 RepID=UPI0021A42EFB|nr:oligosaccharide flippase family protein [Sulfitobacter sp. W027]UWR35725.1 oligosaccharide flippase family protein [Sulfitobacter sp. W027]